MSTIDAGVSGAGGVGLAARDGRRSGRGWNVWVGLLVTGLVIGFGSFVYQWSAGLTVTGLSNTITWGLYIVAFMFLVGISAGGLIVVTGSSTSTDSPWSARSLRWRLRPARSCPTSVDRRWRGRCWSNRI